MVVKAGLARLTMNNTSKHGRQRSSLLLYSISMVGTPLFWLLSNRRLEWVLFVKVLRTFSNRLLLCNQDKGWPTSHASVADPRPLPLPPGLNKPLYYRRVRTHDEWNDQEFTSVHSKIIFQHSGQLFHG